MDEFEQVKKQDPTINIEDVKKWMKHIGRKYFLITHLKMLIKTHKNNAMEKSYSCWT